MTQVINDWLEAFSRLQPDGEDIQTKLIRTLLIVLSFWVLRFLIIKVVNYETRDVSTRYWWRKITDYTAGFLVIVLVGRIWLGGLQSIATFLGLASAGLVIALQGPISDLAGWIFVVWRRPFQVGDRIQLGEHTGDVIDIRLFQFALLEIRNWVDADQSTGRIIHIPNRKVFNEGLANYSEGFDFIWNEIPILITFESDWESAKAILQDVANQHAGDASVLAASQVERASRHFMIRYSKLTPIVYTQIDPYGIRLTVRHLTPIRRRRSSAQAIWEDILRAFAQEPNINFAYPTQRLYSNWLEGHQTIGRKNELEGISIDDLRPDLEDGDRHNQQFGKSS